MHFWGETRIYGFEKRHSTTTTTTDYSSPLRGYMFARGGAVILAMLFSVS
jgi:hypothetical protein